MDREVRARWILARRLSIWGVQCALWNWSQLAGRRPTAGAEVFSESKYLSKCAVAARMRSVVSARVSVVEREVLGAGCQTRPRGMTQEVQVKVAAEEAGRSNAEEKGGS